MDTLKPGPTVPKSTLLETPIVPAINPLMFGAGNLQGEILLVGEYFSPEEAYKNKPLVGSSGFELQKMFGEAGIPWDSTYRTVVAGTRPLKGDVRDLFHPTAEKKIRRLYKECYPKPIVLSGIERLKVLIERMSNLKLIITLGNLPLWALTELASVTTVKGYKVPGGAMKWRGSQLLFKARDREIPLLPLISPGIIQKDYSQRFITVHDLKARAKRYLEGKPWHRTPEPYFVPRPTFTEAMNALRYWQSRVSLEPFEIATDIETWRRSFISCIGLGDMHSAICIPFFYFTPQGMVDVYTLEEEITLWTTIRELLQHPNCRVLGQNFIYDTEFLYRQYFINCNVFMDTMLAHHLCWPGTPKALDRLASLYCDHYVYWKDESQDWTGAFDHESLWKYNCKDIRETYDIAQELKQLITTLGFEEQWSLQLSQWKLARGMMRKGTNTNRLHLQKINQELTAIAVEIEKWLLEVMPPDLQYAPSGIPWYSSPTQQKLIFYEVLGLQPILHKKTKQPTLDATALPQLKEKNPWLSALLNNLENLRSVAVFRSHFLDMKLSFDGRLRCSFNVGGTETFRWSSSSNAFGEGTNFQNIPKGDD